MATIEESFIAIDKEEPLTHWTDDTASDHENDSISSEEETDCESDSEQKCHARPLQEIWDAVSVWTGLQMLPDAEQLLSLIKSEHLEDILTNPFALRTGLLLSLWTNNKDALKYILDNDACPEITDDFGRTALHLAAFQGHAECIQLLLDAGANVNVWDSAKKATPLHCAASRGCLQCVKILMKSGADVNAGLSGRSALHYAVQSNALDCVKELLEHGACPNTPQVYTETPLHVAAAMGYIDCITLLLKHGADTRVQFGPEKTTALHLTAEDGNADCAKLLLDAGADVNTTNRNLQTPLHLAALAQSGETLELLLNKGANPNAGDKDGRTPLHSAIVKVSRSSECVKVLLKAGANVNKADSFGYTPLHIAALNEFSQCVLILINYGGDLTARTNGGISVLNFIIRRTPDVMPKFLSRLDSSIKLNDHEIGDVDCELKLDFRILVPSVGRGETDLLLNFIQVGQRDILKHPLCETFLYLKWERIRKFFLLSLFYHTLFVILFTAYVIGVYARNCPSKEKVIAQQAKSRLDSFSFYMLAKSECKINEHIARIGYVLIVFNCMFLMKEIFQILHNWKRYLRHWDNWLQWFIIIFVYLCAVPGKDIERDAATWQHHIAAIGIFLAWLELMMIVGRFPMFGLYVQMFATVAVNFAKFLLAYSCLLMAFGLSFGVLFANYKSFDDVLVGLIKTIIMMSGELEFEDIFFNQSTEDERVMYPGTAHITFLAFVLLVTVILTNLMVGLAVSDIQGLQQSAGLDRLVRQAELVAHLESMLFSELLHYNNCILKRLLAFFHRSALLLTSQYHWTLYIRPNDPRESKIPKELVHSIYQLIAERKDRKGRKSNKSRKMSYGVNSSQSIHKSDLELQVRLRTFSTSETVSCSKAQLYELSEELKQYSMVIQQKISQLIRK